MADQIHYLAEKFVAENASHFDGQPEEEAIQSLKTKCRRDLQDQGWEPDDFQIDLDRIVRNGLRLHQGG